MTALTLFPARIRWCNPDGTLTPEAVRMLEILVDRVGGMLGDNGIDVFAPFLSADGAGIAPDVTAPAGPAPYMAPTDMQPVSAGAMLETTFQGSSQ